MPIFSGFKTLTDQRVTFELENDLSVTGTLQSIGQQIVPTPDMLARAISKPSGRQHQGPRRSETPHVGDTSKSALKTIRVCLCRRHGMIVCFTQGSVVWYVQFLAERLNCGPLKRMIHDEKCRTTMVKRRLHDRTHGVT
ncbi:hypothetical protein L226DRAFT_96717 [Lentinus tigrinus ALCF2SS1-7]|uniref:uncharacterized protein n=1 Tax=Lentinus tigrinus ALCF2SS1-7 TaxID=1328758 RepID=UPI00116610CC|nr:hypothetical protein L226DRAFT_96717 [Lentinus tigrinus ALCF2SS1-7]